MYAPETFKDLKELARKGFFRRAKHCRGFWERANGKIAKITINNEEYKVTGFTDCLYEKLPFAVQYQDGDSFYYIRMHRTSISFPEKKSHEKGFVIPKKHSR